MKNFLKSVCAFKLNIRNTIAIVVVFSITGIIILGHYKSIPDQNKELIAGAVNQYIVVGFAVVIAYFFVSSKAEVDKEKHEMQTSGKPPLESLIQTAKNSSLLMQDRQAAVAKIKELYPEIDDAICQNFLK